MDTRISLEREMNRNGSAANMEELYLSNFFLK